MTGARGIMVPTDDLRARLATAALAAVGWAYLGLAYALGAHAIDGVPLCPWLAFTGTPCPLCGTTRAWGALLHGRPGQAFAFNGLTPLLLLPWCALTIACTRAAISRRAIRPRRRGHCRR